MRDFVAYEAKTVKQINPDLPVTTNFMQFWEIDYFALSKYVDVISWDNYPKWHTEENEHSVAAQTALFHSFFNSLKKDKPFMLMESSPSATNWQEISKLRRPGMHLLASLQAVAHGSDTVQYFQWRKSRGQSEQFHGAVVGHDNSENTRIFKEVAEVGRELKNLAEIAESLTRNEAAILFDYDSFWSLSIAQAYRNTDEDKGYLDTLLKNFGALWQLNIGCDFVCAEEDFSPYKVIVAPMLFMVKKGLKEKIEKFVENGGVFITTFCSGVVDEYGLSFFDEACYPFRQLLGVKAEETDALYDGQSNSVCMFGNSYKSEKYCEVSYAEGATVIGTYEQEFYRDMPAVTVNCYGRGKAYYIATDLMLDGYIKLYREWLTGVISKDTMIPSPENVSITMRYGNQHAYVFVMNFNGEAKQVDLPFDYEVISGNFHDKSLAAYGIAVLKKVL